MKRSTIARTTLSVRLALILVLTLGFLYNFVLVKLTKSATLDEQIEEVSEKVDMDLKLLGSARKLLEIEQREHMEWEESVLTKIPLDPQQNEILDRLNQLASEVGLRTLNSYADGEEELEKARGWSAKDKFYRTPVTIEVAGSFAQVASFVSRIAEMPRTAKLKRIRIERRDEFFPGSSGKISLDIFHCKKDPAQAAR